MVKDNDNIGPLIAVNEWQTAAAQSSLTKSTSSLQPASVAIFSPNKLRNSPLLPPSLIHTMNNQEPPPLTPTLRRRNSIATSFVIPAKLSLHTSSLPPSNLNGTLPSHLDISLLPVKSSLSYTSLKDLLPSATVNSPTHATSTTTSTYEISIRNRLVKQAAWAYLQPMSSYPDSSGTHFLRRLWLRLSTTNPITSCFRFISVHVIPSITNAFDRILCAIRVHFNR